ncbi:MAG TPA: hypothetical protein VHV55_18990 [Pirellulales bacterium]|jgi:hypothetical protein|nr:hypothetical protein [Pirellulales bacterium]
MGLDLQVDVAALGDSHRRALEEVLGRQLATNQRLIISVTELETPPAAPPRAPQTLQDWTNIYEGLSDEQVEAIDKIAKTRANLTRSLP